MKSYALFVDDEPLVLSGLRRMLRSLRHDWEMSFATSAVEALDLLEDGGYAVVVSDMRMPGMDGAALLNEVATRHPSIARLALSGHAELEAILRAVRPAHQFLAKPCDPKLLEGALRRIRDLSLDRQTGAIASAFGAHRRLPSPSATIENLRAALGERPADLDKVGAIVGTDIAMSMQVLRLVNSAFFGPPTKTLDPCRAVSILGADIMLHLLDDVGLFRRIDSPTGRDEAAVIELNARAAELAGMAPSAKAASGAAIDPGTLTMMALAGPLAALEVNGALDAAGERALGKHLLAFWGLDVDLDAALPSSVADALRPAALQDA